MTVDVHSIDAGSREIDVVSPELALVDPELGRAARALLASDPHLAHSRPGSPAAGGTSAFGTWSPAEPVRPVREQHSRRLLIGVAVATMLALLLLDVRVEVGERPAAADSSESAADAGSSPSDTSTPRQTRPPGNAQFRPADRRFAWAPVPGASGYQVEFFRGSSRVFAKKTTGPLVTVPAEWTINGNRRSLRPGPYRWYVWPIVKGRRQSHATVQATVSVP